MTLYSYKASGKDGKELSGSTEAHSLQAARDNVIAMNLDPIEIYEAPKDHVVHNKYKTPEDTSTQSNRPDIPYLPLFETMRLYAGWLLAWYALIYIIGAYQFTKDLPFRIPYAESLFLSPLVLSFTFAAFLFLLLSSIYKALGKKKPVAFLLLIIGVALFLVYRVNVQ